MKSFLSTATVALAVFVSDVTARTFTVKNNCAFTIWCLYTDVTSPSKPTQATGWQQDAQQSVSFDVPNDWKSGRLWGRTNCDFSQSPAGPNSCLTGGCNGGLECDPNTGTGVPPVTLAEFTLDGDSNLDNYDVSLVDGFNLPMTITNNVGCDVPSCPVDLNPNCPAPLKGPTNPQGQVVGCKSACAAGLGDPTNNPNCCTGTHNTQATCPSSGVQYYDYFKSQCKNAYAYAYDEPSGTALFHCDSGKAADYTITFCP
ncbi:thaumatin-like protein [Daedaleopsis nitida]|nr:thaumatin-like protein [Daedaleopsis nitida]